MAPGKGKKKATTKPMERFTQQAGEFGEKLSKRAEESAEETRRRAAKVALAVLEFEKSTFDNAYRIIDKIQKHTEDLVKERIANAEWMPEEGRAVVEEWTRMLQGSRREFHKTVDKSFDHLTEYVKRLQEAKKPVAPKKAAPKKPAARKTVAKKAPMAKRAVKQSMAAAGA